MVVKKEKEEDEVVNDSDACKDSRRVLNFISVLVGETRGFDSMAIAGHDRNELCG